MDGAIAGHCDAIIQNQPNAANESVCALTSVFTTCGLLHVPVASCTSALPIHAFYVIVHFNTHRTSAFQSPVFNNLWEIVALHHAGGDRDAQGTWLNNEGIRIDAVVDDLRDHFSDIGRQDVLDELRI